MKQLVKTSLYALILGAGASVTYAAETERHDNGRKNIPIELKVHKNLQVHVGDKISLNQNGTPSTSWFKVITNVPYSLNLSTANRGVNNDTYVLHSDRITQVATRITTKKDGTSVPFGTTNYTGNSTDRFVVEARTASAVPSNQKQGIYTDQYQINVTY